MVPFRSAATRFGRPALTSDCAPMMLRVRPAQLTTTSVSGRGAAALRVPHQLRARRADAARNAHRGELVVPPRVEHHHVGAAIEQRLQVLGRNRRRVPCRLDQLTERLARGVDVAKELAAVAAPSVEPARQLRHVVVAERTQRFHRVRDEAFAGVVDDDPRTQPGDAVEHVGFEAPNRQRCRKQRVPVGEGSLFAHVEQRDLVARAQRPAHVFRRHDRHRDRLMPPPYHASMRALPEAGHIAS